MKFKRSLLFICCLLSSCAALHAQVMNIEQERIKTDTTGWAGTAQTSLQYFKNKSEVWNIGAHLHLQFKTNKSLYLCLTDYSLSKSAGADFANAGIQHLRYNYKITDWFTMEAFTQAQFNKLLSVDFRWLLGAGPRFKVVKTKPFRMYAAALYMYEYEELADTTIIHRDHRLSTYASLTLKIKNNLSLINTTYFQPKFSDFSDFRLSSQTDMKIGISKHFAFKLSYIYYYDTFPAFDVPKETLALQNALSLEFYKKFFVRKECASAAWPTTPTDGSLFCTKKRNDFGCACLPSYLLPLACARCKGQNHNSTSPTIKSAE